MGSLKVLEDVQSGSGSRTSLASIVEPPPSQSVRSSIANFLFKKKKPSAAYAEDGDADLAHVSVSEAVWTPRDSISSSLPANAKVSALANKHHLHHVTKCDAADDDDNDSGLTECALQNLQQQFQQQDGAKEPSAATPASPLSSSVKAFEFMGELHGGPKTKSSGLHMKKAALAAVLRLQAEEPDSDALTV